MATKKITLNELRSIVKQIIKEEYKSEFDVNNEDRGNEYAEDESDFNHKYGSIYDFFDSLDKEIYFDTEIEYKIFNKLFNEELLSLNKISKDQIDKAEVEKIRVKKPYNFSFKSERIWTLPNGKYAFWSNFHSSFLAGNNKEEVIKLAFIERQFIDDSIENELDRQTKRAEGGWVD